MMNATLRTWWVATGCLNGTIWVHACVQGWIRSLHQLNVVKASSHHMARVSCLVVPQIELMEMIGPMNNRMSCVVARRILVLLKWMKVMISVISLTKLAMTISSFSSATSKLATRACYWSHIAMMLPKRKMRSSWIVLIATWITALTTWITILIV